LRQGLQKYVRGTGSATDRPSAAVEKRQARVMSFCYRRQFALGLMKTPLAAKDAAIFIAVAIAEHHDYIVHRAAHRDGMTQECIENPGTIFEVANGFKKRRDGQLAG
jgi:hypothetical protein